MKKNECGVIVELMLNLNPSADISDMQASAPIPWLPVEVAGVNIMSPDHVS